MGGGGDYIHTHTPLVQNRVIAELMVYFNMISYVGWRHAQVCKWPFSTVIAGVRHFDSIWNIDIPKPHKATQGRFEHICPEPCPFKTSFNATNPDLSNLSYSCSGWPAACSSVTRQGGWTREGESLESGGWEVKPPSLHGRRLRRLLKRPALMCKLL